MAARTPTQAQAWQSKAILLIVLPLTVTGLLLQSQWWMTQIPVVAWTALGISGLFGLIVWKLKAGTERAAATGAAITASLMFSTTQFPYTWSWLHGALLPLMALFLLTFAATRAGKAKKQRLGVAEDRHGRNAAQVAANLGFASLIALGWTTVGPFLHIGGSPVLGFLAALAALAEAAADTVSSEIGQALGGTPRMLTTLRRVEPGTDGGITLTGTAAGALAALIVAALGVFLYFPVPGILGRWPLITLVTAAGVFGLLFDSLLGATLEGRGWLNNDAVNFLSTVAASACATAGLVWLASRVIV